MATLPASSTPRGFNEVLTAADTDFVPIWPNNTGAVPGKISVGNLRTVFNRNGLYFYSDGTVDTWNTIQTALNNLATLTMLGVVGNGYRVDFSGTFLLSQSLIFPAPLRGIKFTGGIFYPIAGGGWSSITPILEAACRRCTFDTVKFDCLNLCAGFLNSGGNNDIGFGYGMHYRTYGFNMNGAVGGSILHHCRASQWGSSDAQYTDQSQWTAYGVWQQVNDDKIFDNIISVNGVNAKFGPGAGTILFSRNHVFNGSTASVPNRPKNIVVDAGAGQVMIQGNYLDNGEIDLFNDNVFIEGNQHLYNPANCTLTYVIGLYYNGTNFPSDFQIGPAASVSAAISNGTIPFLKVLSNGGSFLGDYTHYDNTGKNMPSYILQPNLTLGPAIRTNDKSATFISPNTQAFGTHVDYVDADTDPLDPPNFGSAGSRLRARSSNLQIVARDDTGGSLTLDSNDQYGVRLTSAKWTWKTAGTDRMELNVDALEPVTDGTCNLGVAGLRWATAHVKSPRFYPSNAETIGTNGGVAPQLTSDTVLSWRARGSDGTTRTIHLPIAATALSAIASVGALTLADDDLLQVKSGNWVNRSIAQYLVDLQGTGLSTSSAGFRGRPVNSKAVNYTLVASDNGKCIRQASGAGAGRTFTIDSHTNVAWPDGATLHFENRHATFNMTIAVTTDTLQLANTATTGSRTLAPNGQATFVFDSATNIWLCTGPGLT